MSYSYAVCVQPAHWRLARYSHCGLLSPLVVNPFAAGGRYTDLGCLLRSVESGTQLFLALRPDLARYGRARSIELLGTTRVGR
jgi:hypothetical protein